jgi:hypothetical protein
MEVLGLLAALEDTIMKGRKIPMTENVVIFEPKVLEIIDKMRVIIKGGAGAAKRAIENLPVNDPNNEKVVVSRAQREARLLKEDAESYVDQELAKLLATAMKIERTVENTRKYLTKTRGEGNK